MSSTFGPALTAPRRATAHRRRLLALGLVVAVVASTAVTVTPADAEALKPERLPVQVEKLDRDGREVRGIGWKPKPEPVVDLPEPRWPAAGSARVVMPAAGSPGAARSGRLAGDLMRAGELPVSVGQASSSAGAAPAEVAVEVLDRAKVPPRWRDGVVTRLAAPVGAAAGTAAVSVDYGGFRHAYGAGWASRLQLWSLPECALTTPEKAGCAATPLRSRRDPGTTAVTADVPVSGPAPVQRGAAAVPSGSLVALAAGPSGSAGDFKATSLAPSSTWTAGGSSGAFAWSYPMRVPAAMGGPAPDIALSYSSASVDGRSAATNNQPSWIGEGFEFWPGYVERRYIPCSEDEAGSANNPRNTGDLCWRSDNAVLSLNGSSSELIYEAGKGWRGRSENGSRIEKLTGATNGDDNGEHWKVTTTDGTQYFFGLQKPPGESADTQSAWTVPVYGNHAGEPCHASGFADSRCNQAWRWNLDYVVDVRGNTMSYWYDKETNQYAAEATASKNVAYVRGGTLARIDYGTWDRGAGDRSVNPAAQVLFETADRCLSDCGQHDAQHWPDVPWDQECKVGATTCEDIFSPTFWSTKRLAKITTRVWDTTKPTAAWQDVESYAFGHSFPSPGDGSDPGLWLKSVVHAGHVGGTITMPPVTLEPVSLPNRVLTMNNTTNNWQRLSNIYTETGARVQVTYSQPECTASNLPADAHTNTKLCYPVIGPDPYKTGGPDITEWWHKYVVRQVSETDVQLADGHQTPTVNTYYTYGGAPAWHYADDDGFSKPKRKTWSQFRGYATVSTQVGDTQKTLSKTTYLRGMHGDRASPSGGTRSVTVPATMGSEAVYDEDEFAGMARETVTYNGTEDKPTGKTVNVPWRSPATASRTINGDTVTARYVNTRVTYSGTALGVNGNRGWRITSKQTDFDDTYGTVNWSQDNGDVAVSGDETCVRYAYSRNAANNLVALPRQTTSIALTCSAAPATTDHIVSDSRIFYDGASSDTAVPVRGEPTRVDELKDWSAAGGTVWQTIGRTSYDVFGRIITATDAKNNTTTTSRSPATGLAIEVKETNHLGWSTTTWLSPYWASPTKTVDPNNRTTETAYDPLGRVAAAWGVGWPRATNPDKPSARFSYAYSPNRSTYPHIRMDTLNVAGNYVTSYQIFDAFLRPRQNQSPAVGGGRVVTDTLYDAWGRASTAYGAHFEPGDASGNLWWEPEWSVPSQSLTIFDRAGRPEHSVFRSGDGVTNIVERWRTSTVYAGDQTTVTPPQGGTVTTTISDAQGRTSALRQYTTAAGAAGAYDTTHYTHNRKNQLTSVTDPAGNKWTYTYDVRGRQIESQDPDKGLSRSEYNDFDELVKTTDARGQSLVHTYDSIGRKTAMYNDAVSADSKRAEWIYDRLYEGGPVRGALTQTIRYDAGNAYKWQARAFDSRGQVASDHYIIPASETGLAGVYVYNYQHSPFTGARTGVGYPAGGNLTGELVTTRYDEQLGLPRGLDTNLLHVGSYVIGQQYTPYAEPTLTSVKTAGGLYTEEAVSYDPYTRRVSNVQVKPETSPGTIVNRSYDYEPAGGIRSITDTPQVGSAETQCFTHDALQRLTSAWTPKTGVPCSTAPSTSNLGGPAPYWLDWTIDKIGNRTKEVSHTASGDTVKNYTVPTSGAGAVRPHAVTSATTTTPGQTSGSTTSYNYDQSGNMTTRPGAADGQTLTWDVEGKLTKVVEGNKTTTNLYDTDGTRLIRRDATGSTLYLPGMEIRRTVSGGTTALEGTRYYSFAGKTIASRTPGNENLSWLFTDHHGTQQTTVNAYTQAVAIRRQDPYGAPRGQQPSWPNQKGFVGGDLDPTGLTHIGAREYDPGLGRFISVDPVHDLTDPQQWNAYAYANNSPVRASDPTGLKICSDDRCGPGADYVDSNGKYNQIKGHNDGCGGCSGARDPDRHRGRGPGYGSDRTGRDGGVRDGRDGRRGVVPSGGGGGSRRSGGDGPSDDEVRRAQEIQKQNTVDVIIKAGGQVLMEFFGINDILSCIQRGDLKACGSALIGALPWGKVFKAVEALPALIRAGKAVSAFFEQRRWAAGVLARFGKCDHSFAPSTLVLMADGKRKKIKDVKLGDRVMATDPVSGKTVAKVVTALHSHEDTALTDVTVTTADGERAVLQATQNHPFWDEATDAWVEAADLRAGRSLLTAPDGETQAVSRVRSYTGSTNMRDLTVADIHTYYVLAGKTPVLVHNCDGATLELTYKPGWSSSQIAEADAKVAALNSADSLVVTAPNRGSTSAADVWRRGGNAARSGADIDHKVDLQLGGADHISNMWPLDSSVNRSLGSQINAQIIRQGLQPGAVVCSVTIRARC